MDIKKEDVDKLKQSDRIELLLKLNYIENIRPKIPSMVCYLCLIILNYIVFGISAVLFAQLGDYHNMINMLIFRKIGLTFIILIFFIELIFFKKRLEKFNCVQKDIEAEFMEIKPKEKR